jgi:hypothetical protein
MSRLFALAALAGLASGCVDARAARLRAARGATLVVESGTPKQLIPDTELVLANPTDCFEVARFGGTGGNGYGAIAVAALLLGCVGVVTVVDIVALPPLAIIRHGEESDLAKIAVLCPLGDPVARATEHAEQRLVEELGFVRWVTPPSEDPFEDPFDAQQPIAVVYPQHLVRLHVHTTRFARSGGVTWKATMTLHDGTEPLFSTTCEEHSPKRRVSEIEHDCAAARAEVDEIAEGCADEFVEALGQAMGMQAPSPGPQASSSGTRER